MHKPDLSTGGRIPASGFTLMEIVVSVVLLAIGIWVMTGGYIGGRLFLKQEEDKSRAMSVASVKMEEYLTKPFSNLEDGVVSGSNSFPDGFQVNWTVQVAQGREGNNPSSGVPYKHINVTASYNERKASDASQVRNDVRLTNIVPYPYIHVKSIHVAPLSNQPAVPLSIEAIPGVAISIDYAVDKDLMVVYNVAIEVESSSGLQPIDTIYTECYLDGVKKDIVTRTPIMMQPLISNVIGVNEVSRGPHTIELKWYKDTNAGRIILKEANMIVTACEHR